MQLLFSPPVPKLAKLSSSLGISLAAAPGCKEQPSDSESVFPLAAFNMALLITALGCVVWKQFEQTALNQDCVFV